MARKIESATKNFNKRDALNSKSANPLKDFEGTSVIMENIVKAAIITDNDEETGEIKNIGVIVNENNDYYTTISATILESIDELIEIIDEEENVKIRINKRLSNNKREFLTLTIL